MELELKHLAPYLPYDLKIIHNYKKVRNNRKEPLRRWLKILEPSELNSFFRGDEKRMFQFKPILRPLSDLTKEITIDKETFIPIKKLGTRYSSIKCMFYENTVQLDVCDMASVNLLHYLTTFEKLYKMHFDVHNLIEKNLAIDINTIK